MNKYFFGIFIVSVALLGFTNVSADHAWGNYHWARIANPFALKLGDNVTGTWDSYLRTASTKWSLSSVLDTSVVTGLSNRVNCRPRAGRVEVCNYTYGQNGWLGIAQIWISGSHITQGVAKMNDTYFNTATYNKPAWKRLVVCQEVAHAFGLDHQDEVFNNENLGTCMDYTNDPDGGVGGASATDPSNEYPNQHDYDMLEEIYAHLDATTTLAAATSGKGFGALFEKFLESRSEWGKAVQKDGKGRHNLFVRDFGKGNKVVTHIFWAEETQQGEEH